MPSGAGAPSRGYIDALAVLAARATPPFGPVHHDTKVRSMRVRLLALAVAAFFPVVVTAQPNTASAEDEDLKFEESIRSFVSGAAWQCLPETERTAHDREVLRAYTGLVQLFGSDRAFFYAAAFGAGTGMSIDKAKCSS
jgi:hypothetical protein